MTPVERKARSWPRILNVWLRALLRGPMMFAVALFFVFDDVVLAAVRPLFRALAELKLFQALAFWLQRQPPFIALLLFGVPFLLLEPPKLFAVYLMGSGQLRSGALLLLALQIATFASVERLFHVLQPTLMQIRWFAWIYTKVMAARDWALGWLKSTQAWKRIARWVRQVRAMSAEFLAWLRRTFSRT